jgi:hypothetical protein
MLIFSLIMLSNYKKYKKDLGKNKLSIVIMLYEGRKQGEE